MSLPIKIAVTVLFVLNVISSSAQFEKGLFSYSNPLLINPSYAGLNKYTTVWTGLEYNRITRQQVYNQFSFTYSKYSHKLGGGTAFYLQQGVLGELNINTTEAGFTVSKHLKYNKSYLIPSLNVNFMVAAKQWFVHFTDEILDKETSPYSPPGAEFFRFYQLRPRAGLMWNSPNFQAGLSVMIPMGKYVASENRAGMHEQPLYTLHFKQIQRGTRKGLVSEPFKIKPQLVTLFGENVLFGRLDFSIEQVIFVYNLFLQSNVYENIHSAGGGIGWKNGNLQINLFTGAGIPVISEKIAFTGEISMILTIPPDYYSKRKPWAPKPKVF